MKNRAKVISELVAINHSFATMDVDIFTIETKEEKIYIFPRNHKNNVFYRIARVSKVLNDNGLTWYIRTETNGSMRVTAW